MFKDQEHFPKLAQCGFNMGGAAWIEPACCVFKDSTETSVNVSLPQNEANRQS